MVTETSPRSIRYRVTRDIPAASAVATALTFKILPAKTKLLTQATKHFLENHSYGRRR